MPRNKDDGRRGGELDSPDGADEVETSNEGTALVPVHEQTVVFYGDPIPVAQTPEGELYVPLRLLAEFLGLDARSQRHRVNRDRVLSSRGRSVVLQRSDGKRVPMFCLPLDLLPGWLFGVDTGRVRPELVEKLERYRAEAFRVLWQAFKGDVLPVSANGPSRDLSGAALALEIATAVQHLARQQLDIEGRLGDVAGRQEVMAQYLKGFIQKTEGRLHNLELYLNTGATISEAQAAEIALAVKNVGQRLASEGDRGGYSKVYSEMYRRYRISSYRNLPATQYDEVLAWLHEWYEELN
jgi:hypothetical protein